MRIRPCVGSDAARREDFLHSSSGYTRTFKNPAKILFRYAAQISRMEKYKAYAAEAIQLAEQSPNEHDRTFWLNIARAWLALMEMLRKR